MRMRSTLGLATLALAFAALAGTARAAETTGTYKLDPDHSYLVFKVQHLGLNWSYGQFGELEGTWTLDEDNAAASSVAVKVAAASIDTHVDKRDQHLRSPDFFNAKQFPSITFASKKVEKTDKGFRVTGDLTLLGVTKSLTVDVVLGGADKDPWGSYRTGLHAEFTIRRSEFGMKWGIAEGVVSDEVHLTLSVEGIRQ